MDKNTDLNNWYKDKICIEHREWEWMLEEDQKDYVECSSRYRVYKKEKRPFVEYLGEQDNASRFLIRCFDEHNDIYRNIVVASFLDLKGNVDFDRFSASLEECVKDHSSQYYLYWKIWVNKKDIERIDDNINENGWYYSKEKIKNENAFKRIYEDSIEDGKSYLAKRFAFVREKEERLYAKKLENGSMVGQQNCEEKQGIEVVFELPKRCGKDYGR